MISVGRRFGRFAGVGAVNTVIDFTIFGILASLGWPMLAANAVSTTAGLGFSFVANRRFTWRDRAGDGRKQAVQFVLGTLFGLWAIQPSVIWAAGSGLSVLGWSGDLAQVWIAKAAGIAVALVWNFAFYSRVVFRAAPPSD